MTPRAKPALPLDSVLDITALLVSIVGPAQVFSGADIGERYRVDISRRYAATPLFMVRPADTDQVAAVVRLAGVHSLPVTVIGGQTSTCGAAVPSDGGIALSLSA